MGESLDEYPKKQDWKLLGDESGDAPFLFGQDKCEKKLNTHEALNENKRKTMERIEVGINMSERSLRRSKC